MRRPTARQAPSALGLIDATGQPLSGGLERVLLRLLPRLRRQFPVLEEDATLTDVVQEAALRLADREARAGPVENLHGYAWVTLRSIATSRLRRGAARVAQRTLSSHVSRARLASMPATSGTPAQIEQHILWREVLATLSPDERLICELKGEGLSSKEIAARYGRSVIAVDTAFSRAKQTIRQALGVPPLVTDRRTPLQVPPHVRLPHTGEPETDDPRSQTDGAVDTRPPSPESR